MPRAVTLQDVGRYAGVSTKTVSNVVNDFPWVSDSMRERVLKAIEELGYQPNLTARKLRSGRSGVIKLVIPDLRNAYFAELANSVIDASRKRGQFVLIEQTGFDRDLELQALNGPGTQLIDGTLFSALALNEADSALIASPKPLVLLGERTFEGPNDHVGMKNVEAARAATDHLLSLGRTRIVALGGSRGDVDASSALRLRGYREALKSAGIRYDSRLVGFARSWHRADGAKTTSALLDRGVSFDGVVAFSDTLALGAMRVLQEEGIRIPEDVAVIGFDDIDETRFSLPQLSTIDAGRDQIAELAVSMLLERIDNPKMVIPPREVFSDFHIVARESTLGRPTAVQRRQGTRAPGRTNDLVLDSAT